MVCVVFIVDFGKCLVFLLSGFGLIFVDLGVFIEFLLVFYWFFISVNYFVLWLFGRVENVTSCDFGVEE